MLEAGLLRAGEYTTSAGKYQYYLDVYQLGHSTNDFFLDHGLDPTDMHIPIQGTVSTLLALDMANGNRTIRTGRIQFNGFNFIEENGQMMTGKQIRSAVIAPDFQSVDLARGVYRMLARKHKFLIYDNIQSTAGGALWAGSAVRIAEVRIYNSRMKKFMDILSPSARGISDTLPWSVNDLSVDGVVHWGRAYDDENCCRHIICVICKDRPIDNQFHDYVSIGGTTE